MAGLVGVMLTTALYTWHWPTFRILCATAATEMGKLLVARRVAAARRAREGAAYAEALVSPSAHADAAAARAAGGLCGPQSCGAASMWGGLGCAPLQPRSHAVPPIDAAIIIVVTVLTPFTDLAIAVAAGVALGCVGFAWAAGDSLRVAVRERPPSPADGWAEEGPSPLGGEEEEALPTHAGGDDKAPPALNENGYGPGNGSGRGHDHGAAPPPPPTSLSSALPPVKVYSVRGPLFFASDERFEEAFTPLADPSRVVLDVSAARVLDFSAARVLGAVWGRYRDAGVQLRLAGLSASQRRGLEAGASLLDEGLAAELARSARAEAGAGPRPEDAGATRELAAGAGARNRRPAAVGAAPGGAGTAPSSSPRGSCFIPGATGPVGCTPFRKPSARVGGGPAVQETLEDGIADAPGSSSDAELPGGPRIGDVIT